jgi:hypothetical protein
MTKVKDLTEIPCTIQDIQESNLIFLLKNKKLEIIKDRYIIRDFNNSCRVSEAVNLFSLVLSEMVFSSNDLLMFKEALCSELVKNISNTIVKFYISEGG